MNDTRPIAELVIDAAAPAFDVREDSGGLESLFRQFRIPLQTYAARWTDDAEDVVQEVYVRMLRAPDIRSVENPRAFLFAVASNILKDRFRLHRSRKTDSHVPVEGLELVCPAPSPLETLEWQQRLDVLEAAFAELDERQKQALVWHRLDRLTLNEIAERMGVTVPVVRGYIARAMLLCSKRLRRTY